LTTTENLEEIVREYGPKVYNLVRRFLGNESDAQDVTQQVLLTVLSKLPEFRGEAGLGTWVYRIAVNAALAYRRKRARRMEVEHAGGADLLEQASETSPRPQTVRPWTRTPESEVLSQEQQAVIEDAIARLPEPYRDVYVLADVEGLSNAQIAEILGLHIPAVKSRLHRARLRMRDMLAPYFEET